MVSAGVKRAVPPPPPPPVLFTLFPLLLFPCHSLLLCFFLRQLPFSRISLHFFFVLLQQQQQFPSPPTPSSSALSFLLPNFQFLNFSPPKTLFPPSPFCYFTQPLSPKTVLSSLQFCFRFLPQNPFTYIPIPTLFNKTIIHPSL